MLKEYLSTLANKFRSVLGTKDKIKAQDFESKIEEVLDKGVEEGQLNVFNSNESLKCDLSGAAVVAYDVSSVEHNVDVRLSSKNLCSNNYADYGHDKVYAYKHIGKIQAMITLKDKDTSVDVSGCYLGFANDPDVTSGGILWVIQAGVGKSRLSNEGGEFGYLQYLAFYPNREEALNRMMQRWDIQLELNATYTTTTDYTPYISDLSTVEVSRYGKNIFDADAILPTIVNPSLPTMVWEKQTDGSFRLGNTGALVKGVWFKNSDYKGSISVSVSAKIPQANETDNGLTLVVRYTDETNDVIRFYGCEDFVTKTIVSNPNKTVDYIDQSYNVGVVAFVKNIMIAYGTDTEYEPYIDPTTYHFNADGTPTEAIKSIAPNMTLLTNNNGVVINARCYTDINTLYPKGKQDAYNTFMDSVNINPAIARVDYDYLFAGVLWNDITFVPKYDIIPASQNVNGIFYNSGITDLKAVLETYGKKLDFTSPSSTSGCQYISNLFRDSSITHIPALKLSRALNLQMIFYNCANLHTVDEFDIGEKVTYIYQLFNSCSALENIVFKGTVKCNGVSLANSTKLSKASIESLINCLSTSTSGLTVTLSAASVKKAFETSSGSNDGNTSDEWKNLIATKSNWTITLS